MTRRRSVDWRGPSWRPTGSRSSARPADASQALEAAHRSGARCRAARRPSPRRQRCRGRPAMRAWSGPTAVVLTSTADYARAAVECGAAGFHPEGPAQRPGAPCPHRRDMRSSLQWLVAPAAVVCAAVVRREQLREGRPWTFLLPELVGGLALIAAGRLVRWNRAGNRCWWLLVAAGFAWFVGDFEHSTNPDVALVAFAFLGWQALFLAWVSSPTRRAAAAAGAIAWLVAVAGRSLRRAHVVSTVPARPAGRRRLRHREPVPADLRRSLVAAGGRRLRLGLLGAR